MLAASFPTPGSRSERSPSRLAAPELGGLARELASSTPVRRSRARVPACSRAQSFPERARGPGSFPAPRLALASSRRADGPPRRRTV